MSFLGVLFAILFPPRIRMRFVIRCEGFYVNVNEGFIMRINDRQKVLIGIAPLNLAGEPAAIDGEVDFQVSDASVVRIERVDATSAYLIPVGPSGSARVLARADADLDEGETRTIEASGVIEVVSAEAQTLEITFGIPEDR